MVYNFFDKKSAGSSITKPANAIKQNRCTLDLDTQQIAEKLHKPIIAKLKKELILHLRMIFGVLI